MRSPISCATLAAPAALAAWISTAVAMEAQPSFGCAKAKSLVETLICSDAELAALDRSLSEVCGRALKRHEEQGYEDPRPVQRGWITGRNECWKAADVRQCVETKSKHRIADLQIAYGDLVVPEQVNYSCGDVDLAAVFYQATDPPTVVLTPIGRHQGPDQAIAYLVPSGSGAKYEGPDVSFWEHHGEAMLTWLGKEHHCTAP